MREKNLKKENRLEAKRMQPKVYLLFKIINKLWKLSKMINLLLHRVYLRDRERIKIKREKENDQKNIFIYFFINKIIFIIKI